MRAMRVHEKGGELTLDHLETPEPGKGEVRLSVRAAGVNFADTLMVQNRYQATPVFPFAPGIEICGVVDAVGDAVLGADKLGGMALGGGAQGTEFSVGDRVLAACGSGGFADTVVCPASSCLLAPEGVSDEEIAGLAVVYGTAHMALDYKADLKAGERLLVTGAAGGAGLAAVEVGALLGAEIVAVARGADKLALAEAKGATHLIDADDPDLVAKLKALGGVDVAYDTVGGDMFTAALRAAKFEARLLPIGFAGGDVPQIPANIMLVKNVCAIGFWWGDYLDKKPAPIIGSLRTLLEWRAAGRFRVEVSDVVPLERADDALKLLKSRNAMGKVVLKVD